MARPGARRADVPRPGLITDHPPYAPQVHTRETTWYKPEPAAVTAVLPPGFGEDAVNLNTDVITHNISISADI